MGSQEQARAVRNCRTARRRLAAGSRTAACWAVMEAGPRTCAARASLEQGGGAVAAAMRRERLAGAVAARSRPPRLPRSTLLYIHVLHHELRVPGY
jgi:hypothetical protein